MSETLNSNTINLVAGLIVPALFVSVASPTARPFDFGSLIAMTLVALVFLSPTQVGPIAAAAASSW